MSSKSEIENIIKGIISDIKIELQKVFIIQLGLK